MNAEDFYAELKNALRFFGVEWGNKEAVKITAEKGVIVFSYANLEVRVKLK